MVQTIRRVVVICSPLLERAYLLLRSLETVSHFIPTALRTEEQYVCETSGLEIDSKLVLGLAFE